MSKSLMDMQHEVEEWVIEKGWMDDRTFGDECALIHSEVSEMLEAFRKHGDDDLTPVISEVDRRAGRLPKPEGVPSEVADVLIRLLDTCNRHGIDLEYEYTRKMEYNETRAHRHGGDKIGEAG